MTGVASLFTTDFFQLARSQLRPGGVFGQWVQLYQLSPGMFQSVVATFHAVFPHVVVFRTSQGDATLVGSERPLHLDLPDLEERLRGARVRQDLRRVGLGGAEDLVARLVLDVGDVAGYARGSHINTDDNGYLEFEAPRHLYLNAVGENVQGLVAAFGDGHGPPAVAGGRAGRVPPGPGRALPGARSARPCGSHRPAVAAQAT